MSQLLLVIASITSNFKTQVKKFDAFTIKATGQALATAVTVAEIIKRRFKGIHQMTKIGSLEVNDEYELKEDEDEKLDKTITQVRSRCLALG